MQTKSVKEIDSAVIRFAGDSGDGMQIVGDQFTSTAAVAGDYFMTLPDYPSEIRAPAGTVYGVSGFQICVGGDEVFTAGDLYDVLVAMNPAALKTNLANLREGGTIIVNQDAFTQKNIDNAGFKEHPLDGKLLERFNVVRASMATQTMKALEGSGLSNKEMDRCKNFFALGVLYRLFNRDPQNTYGWLSRKFRSKPEFEKANCRVLEAGMNFAANQENCAQSFRLKKSGRKEPAGIYRSVSGNTAAALGLIAAAQKSGLKLFLGSYPITPATDIMHELTKHRDFATVFQAEDEIAGVGAALGAAFGGALAVTTTSGPGFSLKSEFMNLAVMVELPLIIVNVQRAGPSTGIPTKTEQSDFMQALHGRHGESPLVVMAASTPKDCFDVMLEASKIALKYMTPVIVLSEGYLGNGSEVWRVPAIEELPEIKVTQRTAVEGYQPYARDPETLARPWAVPGTPGLEHRLGGLEKEDGTGTVSQSPENHEKMVHIRAQKVKRVAREIPPTEVFGDRDAELLVLGWGGTAGVIRETVRKLNAEGHKVACAHLRYLNPLPPDLAPLLRRYKRVLLPENNMGQLWYHLRGELLIDTVSYTKIQGLPFRIDELEAKIKTLLGAR